MTLPDLGRLVRFDERLREVPIDRLAVEAAFAAAKRIGDVTYAGNAARILGRTEESIALLRQALDAAEGDLVVAARIRLGEAFRCAERTDEAVQELEHALAEARRSGTHVDFALQHLGKALIDAGSSGRAVTVLEEALALRRERGDAELVESTRLALARARGA